jgi:hypothetical protein
MFALSNQLAQVVPRLLAGQHGFEQAVDGQIRIASDRRSEVAVAIAGKGIVPLHRGAVNRPLQAPQNGVVDGMLLRTAFDHA